MGPTDAATLGFVDWKHIGEKDVSVLEKILDAEGIKA